METIVLPDRTKDESDLRIALKRVRRRNKWSGYAITPKQLKKIIDFYTAYDECGGAPDDSLDNSQMPHALVKAIKAGFGKTQGRGALSHIRSRTLAAVSRCPICGIGPPRELDHYLPKSKYGAFSIYVRNLVPICHDCNNAKGNRISTLTARRFIHAYFDELPDVNLAVNISIENGGLNAEYNVPDLGDEQSLLRKRLNYQLEKLKLNDRWVPEVIVYMTGHGTGLINAAEADGDAGVARYLSKQAEKEERKFHKSHWRPVLLRALAENIEFCDGGFKDVLALENEQVEALEVA